MNAAKEINNHTGNTEVNVFNALSACNGLTHHIPLVAFPIISSHNKKNNHDGINASAIEKKKTSIHSFFSSGLLIGTINLRNAITKANNTPKK